MPAAPMAVGISRNQYHIFSHFEVPLLPTIFTIYLLARNTHHSRLIIASSSTAKGDDNVYNLDEKGCKCLMDLRATDPRDDKARIERTKGGLFKDSYRWILTNPDFQRWRYGDDHQSQLLWIKGDPGKGKAMLLCGIMDELKSATRDGVLSYFFCQGTDLRINSAVAVLRGLIYLLVDQQQSLISHVRKRYDQAGKQLFEDKNAWVAQSKIFGEILHDPNMKGAYFIVDALDECMVDLPQFLNLIAQHSSAPHVKWILSSRNRHDIEQKLMQDESRTRFSLELKGSFPRRRCIYQPYGFRAGIGA